MITEQVDEQTVRTALDLAGRAPSVHNSQPWRWLLTRHSVQLYADLRRWLPATDADGRDLVLSCGAALHHLRVALGSLGVRAVVHRLPNPEEPDHLAAVELHRGHVCDADVRLASAIARRRTDRRRYADWPVPEAASRQLTRQAADQGALLRVIEGPRHTLLAVIRDAARTQEASRDYQDEIAVWSGVHAGSDGVPAANIPRRRGGEVVLRRFRGGELEQVVVDDGDGGGDSEDGALMLVLGTTSDDTLSRLRAGEALSAVLLQATELGLASSPLSQPLEIDGARRILRDDVLDGTLCPQLVLRVGWAPAGEPPVPLTPRRGLEEQMRRVTPG